jgi:hypothetical protein
MLTAALVIQQLIRGRYSLEDPQTVDVLSILSTAWGGLEIVTMLTNRKRRALHDIIAGSVVVRVAPMRRRKAVEPAPLQRTRACQLSVDGQRAGAARLDR